MAKKEKVSDQLKPISIEAAKLLQGMSLVFSGAVKMLEAIEPHVHVDGGFALNLLTGNIPALEEMGRQLKAEEKEEAEVAASGETADGSANEAEKVEEVKAEPEKQESTSTPSVTADDITRIIVRKIKQNKDNNEKIGQILATYGVKKVSALKPEQYESFVTDLAAI